MLMTTLIVLLVFVLLPIIYSLGYAFTDFYLLRPNDINFIGFQNFETIFKELTSHGEIFYALRNTALFVVLVVPLQIGLALGLALFCNRKVPGVEAKDFLRDENTAMLWIVLLSAWQGCGYQMLIFLSTLGNIQKDLYEAAALDGANSFKRFLHITIPGLKPTFLYVLITVFIGACRVMVQPMLMTGYQTHTLTLSYYMYQLGYSQRWIGLSSSVALVMTIIIGSITLLQRKFLGEKN